MSAPEEEFTIESEHAFVACGHTSCPRCHSAIEVIGLYCARGLVADEPLEAFSVQGIWEIDAQLARQLTPWRHYRLDVAESTFLNHCPRCGAAQHELDLYEEPGQPFYGMPARVTQPVRFLPLQGRVRMSGDYTVDI